MIRKGEPMTHIKVGNIRKVKIQKHHDNKCCSNQFDDIHYYSGIRLARIDEIKNTWVQCCSQLKTPESLLRTLKRIRNYLDVEIELIQNRMANDDDG